MTDEVQGILIAEALGWTKTGDGKHALIMVKDGDGAELALAVNRANLWQVFRILLDAMNAFPVDVKGLHEQIFRPTLDTTWHEVGEDTNTGRIIVTFYGEERKSPLAFRMDRAMAEGLKESLATALGFGPTALP
jgi:hypothetical protein